MLNMLKLKKNKKLFTSGLSSPCNSLISDNLDLSCLFFVYNFAEVQDPYAIVILLQQDLVVIDLLTPGYPCFENPYPMDIHESPVTCCIYLADCPGDLIPAFYSVGSKTQKKSGFSERDW